MLPEYLRSIAQSLEDEAAQLRRLADAVERKGLAFNPADHLARRGKAIARAKADSALKKAVGADKRWGAMRIYARDRLKVSNSSLSAYEHGITPCPRWIDKQVRQDFPELEWVWPAGVVD